MIQTGTTSELVSSLFRLLSLYFSMHTKFSDKISCYVASMARKVYLRGGLGVGAFRRIYGGSKRNGSRPPHFCKSSGGIARHILQQLETMKIVELDTKG